MSGGVNTYAYALGSPIVNTDSNGLWSVSLGGSMASVDTPREMHMPSILRIFVPKRNFLIASVTVLPLLLICLHF